MSQNKTVIQGLEPETNFGGAPNGASSSNFYSRGNQSSAARGTVVPGMMEAQAGASTGNPNPASSPQPRKAVQPGKPIVGFLYSISRTRVGEYWPIQLGKNTIGQGESNDIMLEKMVDKVTHHTISPEESYQQSEIDEVKNMSRFSKYSDSEIERNIIKCDSKIKDALVFSRGLKMIHQDPFETLIAYIISQNNRVPSIANALNLISKNYGKKVIFKD